MREQNSKIFISKTDTDLMGKSIPGYGQYLAKEGVSLAAIFILLLVSSPLGIFYFPALDKMCITIDIFVFLGWMLLLMAAGEVFAEKRGDRIERVLISDNEITVALLLNMTIFAVVLLLVAGVILKSASDSSLYSSPLILGGHAVYFALILYTTHLIMRPTSIETDGNRIQIRPCLAVRYRTSGKLNLPYFSLHFLLKPVVSLLKKSPARKVIEMGMESIQIVPIERNFMGNSKPLLIITDRNSEESNLLVVLENEKSLNLLEKTLAGYLHPPEKP